MDGTLKDCVYAVTTPMMGTINNYVPYTVPNYTWRNPILKISKTEKSQKPKI
jgi:hypothetical protein